eukprot:25393-Eustigmatos_ZCMA.PRE.1
MSKEELNRAQVRAQKCLHALVPQPLALPLPVPSCAGQGQSSSSCEKTQQPLSRQTFGHAARSSATVARAQ